MKKMSFLAGFWSIIILTVTSGCGSLNRSISFEKLTNSDMEYAKSIDYGIVDLKINLFDETSFQTSQSASKAVILPPIIYMRSFGYDSGEYGQLRLAFLWPIIMNMKGVVYDNHGDATTNVSGTMICPIFGYFRGKGEEANIDAAGFILIPFPIIGGHLYSQTMGDLKNRNNCHRFEFLRLPLIGPLFAIDNVSKGRFLWIPCGHNDTD